MYTKDFTQLHPYRGRYVMQPLPPLLCLARCPHLPLHRVVVVLLRQQLVGTVAVREADEEHRVVRKQQCQTQQWQTQQVADTTSGTHNKWHTQQWHIKNTYVWPSKMACRFAFNPF
jgi:hypothetical protein